MRKVLHLLTLLVLPLLLTGCTNSSSYSNVQEWEETRDEIPANVLIHREENGFYFAGEKCIDDCGGHIAGFEWAKSRGIKNPTECGGKSQSFIKGCKIYASSY